MGGWNMNRNKALSWTFRMIIMMLILPATGLCAEGKESPFPQYGKGPVEVRIYTDYFCPPCRAMKPHLEPVLKDLLQRGAITVIWVDTPFNRHSALYAKYFLYALVVKNDSDHASFVRNILNDAASGGRVSTAAQIEDLFRSNRIPYKAFEPKVVFDRYNALIKEDKINATPTCVIIQDGQKKQFIGGPDIINALKGLK
jgi:thiol:disulfide interchange protein DsbA